MELSQQALRLLCAASDGDAALLYLWQTAGDMSIPCPLTPEQKKKAEESLVRLGLVPQPKKPLRQEVRPEYSEDAVRKTLRRRGMEAHFTWDASAQRYMELYAAAMGK